MATIAVTSTSFVKRDDLKRYAAERLGAAHTLKFADGAPLAGDALRRFLEGADAALIGREEITEELLAALPRLKLLSLYGVGFDNVDLDACQRHGARLLVRHGVNADAVAEHTIGLMLAALRNIARASRLLHAGQWVKDGGLQLTGKTVAVVGCGHVGSRVARLLRAFRCRLLLCDVVDVSALATELDAELVPLARALAEADVVTLHVPLTPVTARLIRRETLAAMKRGAVLVNTSRGGVVDLASLKVSLESGHLYSAALDVFESEPMLDDRYGRLEGLVGTPHIAGNAREAVRAMGEAAVDMLAANLDEGVT